MRRVVVVQTAFLGDVVLTTPLFRALKRLEPVPDVTVVTTPVGAALLEGHPAVDGIRVFDKKGSDRGLSGLLRLTRWVGEQGFDAGIAAQRSSRTALVLLLGSVKERIGFARSQGSWGYTTRVHWEPSHHAARRYLALARPLGVMAETEDAAPFLPVRRSAARLLEECGAGDRPVVAIAPGSVWGTKRWTPDGFAAVARSVRDSGLVPILVGSKEERQLCQEVAALSGFPVPLLAGRTGIEDLVALLASCRALVTNDSGPGHVASAVGTPVVAVFGPTVPAFGYAPYGERNRIVEHTGLNCRPCDPHGPQVCPLGHHRCMREIGAERVIAALDELLGGQA